MKIGTFSFLSLCLLLHLNFPRISTAQSKNIVWITAEDLSPRLACYGDSLAHTPNLNRLADEGVVYTNAFATYGVCAPSRHSLIMGMYPTSNGAGAMRTFKRTSAIADITDPELLRIPVYEATPPPYAKCFTEYLRAAGYYCTNNEKCDYQFRPPITAWDENGPDAHFRNRPNTDMPFFSVFNFTVTHESKIHQPPSAAVISPSDVIVPPYYPDTETVRTDMAHHYDNIVALDKQIGKIILALKEDGLIGETTIFFFGDHGDGLPRAKRWVYDSGIQVPMIVRQPGAENNGEPNNELISFVDYAPSVLSLLDLPIPDHMEGQAFLGEQRKAPRKYIYAFRDRMDPAFETIRAVRDQRFKYVRNYRPDLPYIGFIPYRDRMLMMKEILELTEQGKLAIEQWQFWAKAKPLEELYDLSTDPHEIINLASDPTYSAKLSELRMARTQFVENYGDLGLLDEQELIKILWPPSGIQPTTTDPVLQVQDGKLHLSCATRGASIAYRVKRGMHWLLYTAPIPVQENGIEFQAIRLGYKPSQVVSQHL